MKALTNSTRQRKFNLTASGLAVEGTLVENAVADVATIMYRTRLVSLSLRCDNLLAVQSDEYAVPMAIVISVKDYNSIPNPEGGRTLDNILAKCVMAVSANVVRVVAPITDVPQYYVSSVAGDIDVITPFVDLDWTMCGIDYYLVVTGGSYDCAMRVTVVTDRVQITDIELQSLMSC